MDFDNLLNTAENILKKMGDMNPEIQENLNKLRGKSDKEKQEAVNEALEQFKTQSLIPDNFNINDMFNHKIEDKQLDDIVKYYKKFKDGTDPEFIKILREGLLELQQKNYTETDEELYKSELTEHDMDLILNKFKHIENIEEMKVVISNLWMQLQNERLDSEIADELKEDINEELRELDAELEDELRELNSM